MKTMQTSLVQDEPAAIAGRLLEWAGGPIGPACPLDGEPSPGSWVTGAWVVIPWHAVQMFGDVVQRPGHAPIPGAAIWVDTLERVRRVYLINADVFGSIADAMQPQSKKLAEAAPGDDTQGPGNTAGDNPAEKQHNEHPTESEPA